MQGRQPPRPSRGQLLQQLDRERAKNKQQRPIPRPFAFSKPRPAPVFVRPVDVPRVKPSQSRKDYDPWSGWAIPPGNFSTPGAPSGVVLRAHWHLQANGLCEAYRRLARALSMVTRVKLTGFGLRYPTWFPPETEAVPEVLEQVNDLLATPVNEVARINAFAFFVGDRSTVPFLARTALSDEERLSGFGARTVYYTMTEMYKCWPLETVSLINRAAELWVPCQANVECFGRSGVEQHKIARVPIPYYDNDPRAALVGRERAPGVPRLYHIGEREERKAQDQLLLALLRAAKPGQFEARFKYRVSAPPAVVNDKAMALSDPTVQSNGWTEALIDRFVQFHCEVWTEDQITALHAWGDINISSSRGEGWNMPARDAKLAGNRLVHVPSGGSEDFAGVYDLPVRITGYGPSPFSGVVWAQFDPNSLRDQLKLAICDDFRPLHNRDVDLEYHRAIAVGQQMKKRLIALGAPI
jgi:hypothetical protein